MSYGVGQASPDRDESMFSDPRTRLLTKREIAEFLGKSENSVDRLRKKRAIPFLIVGGSIRFRLADVERALERYRVKEVAL
jgi:excisionase family DNA binding protein